MRPKCSRIEQNRLFANVSNLDHLRQFWLISTRSQVQSSPLPDARQTYGGQGWQAGLRWIHNLWTLNPSTRERLRSPFRLLYLVEDFFSIRFSPSNLQHLCNLRQTSDDHEPHAHRIKGVKPTDEVFKIARKASSVPTYFDILWQFLTDFGMEFLQSRAK